MILVTLWPHLRRHKRAMVVAMVAMLGEVVTQLLSPWPLKFVFDTVLFSHSGGKLAVRTGLSSHIVTVLVLLAGAALLIAVLDAVCTYIDGRISEVVAQRSIYDLRLALFTHLQRLSIGYHQHRDTQVGDLLSRLSADVQAVEDLASDGVSNLVTNGVALVAMTGVLLWLDWRLAAVAVLSIVPMFLVAQSTTVRMRSALRVARRQEGQVNAVLAESLTAIKLVQAYGREDHEERRLAEKSAKSLEAKLVAARVQAQLSPYLTVLGAAGVAAVTGLGVVLVVQGQLSPGGLLIALGYLRNMQSPVKQLAKLSFSLGKAAAGVERIHETFAQSPQVAERPGAFDIGVCRGELLFEDVTFGYREGEPVLRDVSLHVAAGSTVALVGTTGSGKSTLLSLLPRFYDPWAGRVLLDGIDVRDLTLPSLRRQIALVLQDSLIFRASIWENVAYGRPDASPEEIEAAAEVSGLLAISASFEDGMQTVVSERGTSLSGGQKQCIGVARAILKDAPIVVLDEPTSSMDSRTEHLVMSGLERLADGRTTLVIAHRLATVRNATSVAVMSGGELVEQGAPDDLLARRGQFAEFAALQSVRRHRRTSSRPHPLQAVSPPILPVGLSGPSTGEHASR